MTATIVAGETDLPSAVRLTPLSAVRRCRPETLGRRCGRMDQVTGSDLLREAVAELYSSSPEEFVERRRVLVARARAAGEASVAKQIAALRKPTRSAWVINQLIRSAPAVI